MFATTLALIATRADVREELDRLGAHVAAARELLYKAASMAETNHPQLGKYSAMAKLFASETANRAAKEGLQIFGGNGYVKDYPVEKLYRDMRVFQIYDGPSEIQKIP